MATPSSLSKRREWTVDDLAALSNDFRCELVSGRPSARGVPAAQ
jgi:hypothetical protein